MEKIHSQNLTAMEKDVQREIEYLEQAIEEKRRHLEYLKALRLAIEEETGEKIYLRKPRPKRKMRAYMTDVRKQGRVVRKRLLEYFKNNPQGGRLQLTKGALINHFAYDMGWYDDHVVLFLESILKVYPENIRRKGAFFIYGYDNEVVEKVTNGYHYTLTHELIFNTKM